MVRFTDRLDMTIVVYWDVKPKIKQNQTNQLQSRSLQVICPVLHEKALPILVFFSPENYVTLVIGGYGPSR